MYILVIGNWVTCSRKSVTACFQSSIEKLSLLSNLAQEKILWELRKDLRAVLPRPCGLLVLNCSWLSTSEYLPDLKQRNPCAVPLWKVWKESPGRLHNPVETMRGNSSGLLKLGSCPTICIFGKLSLLLSFKNRYHLSAPLTLSGWESHINEHEGRPIWSLTLAKYFPMCLSFFTCKMGIILASTSPDCCEDQIK